MDTLLHFSRLPALTRITFKLDAELAMIDSPLLFPCMHDMAVWSQLLQPISQLLSQIRLPVVTDFTALIGSRPSKHDLFSFLTNVQIISIGHTIQRFRLDQSGFLSNRHDAEASLLGLDDLRPCISFRNLRHIDVSIGWDVGLTDNELLPLAFAWPHLEQLTINKCSGWNISGGITPKGLLELLQTCRSLREVALVIDTRGYTEFSQSPEGLGLTLPLPFRIDILDSVIEVASVPAVSAYFASLIPPSDFTLVAWNSWILRRLPVRKVYINRWQEVFRRVTRSLGSRPRITCEIW